MSKVLHIDDIVHPGVGPAISIKAITDSYIARYNQFAARDIKIYCIQDKDNYIVHVMVPSEKNDEYEKPVFYDVIFEFYPTSKEIKESLLIRDYGVKVYSNSISWMFDFTYVFNKSDNIPKFIPKYFLSKDAIKMPPKKTNPYGVFGIDRIVFIAMYHLEITTGLRKNRLTLIEMDKTKTSDILKSLMGQEEKLEQVNLENKKLSLRKKAEKLKAKEEKESSVVKSKEAKTDLLVSKIDKNFDSNLKGTFKSNLKNDNTIGKNGMKSSMKSNLKKK